MHACTHRHTHQQWLCHYSFKSSMQSSVIHKQLKPYQNSMKDIKNKMEKECDLETELTW